MALTFRGGFCEVVIFKEGERFDKSNFPEMFNCVSEVRAQIRAEGIAKYSVTFTPNFQDGIKILKSGLLGIGMSALNQKPAPVQNDGVQEKNVSAKSVDQRSSIAKRPTTVGAGKPRIIDSLAPYLAVKFSYPGESDNDGSPAETDWYCGPIFAAPDLDLTNAEMSITLHAFGPAGMLAAVEGAVMFENESALAVVEKLAKPLGVKISFDDGDNQTIDTLKSKKISGVYNEPRLTTIRNILYRAGCEFYMLTGDNKKPTNELRIKSRSSIAEGKIKYSFVMYRQIDPTNNVIPILDFKLDSARTLFLRGSSFGSFQRSVDTSNKKVDQYIFGPESYDVTSVNNSSSAGGALPQETGSGTQFGGAAGIVDNSDPNLTGRSDVQMVREDENNTDEMSEGGKKAIDNFCKFSIQVPGIPRIRPFEAVQTIIEDSIPGISGPANVVKIEHVWNGGDSWVSNLELRQTGGSGAAQRVSNYKNKAKAPINQATEKKDKTGRINARAPDPGFGGKSRG